MSDNEKYLKPVNTLPPDEARKIRSMGGKARAEKLRERKTLAESIRMVLDERTPEGMTKQEAIVAKCLANVYKSGDIRDIKVLAEILGEIKQTFSAEGVALTINASEEGKRNIEKLMEE